MSYGVRSVLGVLLLILGLVLGMILGCTSRPDDPAYDNPFDSRGLSGGDPFQLQAIKSGNTVVLTWTLPVHEDIARFNVLHSLDGAGFSPIDTAAANSGNYIHQTPARNVTNYYKVQAQNSLGHTTSISRVVADSVTAPPFLDIADGAITTATRHVGLSISTLVGDVLVLADNPDLENATQLDATPGDTTISVAWDLQEADSNDVIRHVYLSVETGGLPSPLAEDSIRVQFQPSFTVAGTPSTVAGNVVDLAITDTGVDSMRFAASTEELALATWVAGADLFSGHELGDNLQTQTIYGEFLGDFGFSVTAESEATPDDLGDAGFVINNGEEMTDDATVAVHSDAVALQMRFSEIPDLTGVPWLDYSDTTLITLSEGGGQKVVYGQFRNHWADSPVLSDWITLVAQDLDITFITPADGAIIRGETPLLVQGVSIPATGIPAIDSVKVDLGAGWEAVTGTEQWSLLWDVPAVSADSSVTIRARAWADTLEATDTISVTITQLLVAITAPAAGDTLDSGTVTTVSGTAAPAAGAAPLDRVEVDLGDGWVTATGTGNWSQGWIVPVVPADTLWTVHARAWAGTESATDSVQVLIEAGP